MWCGVHHLECSIFRFSHRGEQNILSTPNMYGPHQGAGGVTQDTGKETL